MCGVLVEEDRFDQQHIGPARKFHDASDVLRVMDDVGHVRDAAARDDPDRRPEFGEGQRPLDAAAIALPAGANRCRVTGAGQHRLLEPLQPWTDWQSHCGELVLPEIDVPGFLQSKTKHRHLVVKEGGADPEASFADEQAIVAVDRR